jgi:hypothetical protein
VFIWALAYGVWMGATWHASTESGLATASDSKTCCQACVTFNQNSGTLSATQDSAKVCLACQLSTVLPDVPRAQFSMQLSAAPEFDLQPALNDRLTFQHSIALPPQRGPPIA